MNMRGCIAVLLLPLLAHAGQATNLFPEPARVLWTDGVQNAYPRWSRDGSQILFQSNRSGKWQIYVMNRDGTDEHRILPSETNQNFPDWSPDNTMIAFVSDRDGNEEVYVAKMDGSGMTNVSNHPGRDIHPYWTPDGKRLLFNSNRDKEESFEVYSVAMDGSHLTRLTETDAVETCARLSPDGKRIVCLRGDTNDEVVVMNSDGSKPLNLTQSKAAEGWPAWSPNGKQVIYSSDEPGRFSLFLMNADGSGKRQLTSPPAPLFDARALISPDGKTVVFNRQNETTIGIYLLSLAKEPDTTATTP